jgi:hypothetical protein
MLSILLLLLLPLLLLCVEMLLLLFLQFGLFLLYLFHMQLLLEVLGWDGNAIGVVMSDMNAGVNMEDKHVSSHLPASWTAAVPAVRT